jgi:hypothetical protein
MELEVRKVPLLEHPGRCMSATLFACWNDAGGLASSESMVTQTLT